MGLSSFFEGQEFKSFVMAVMMKLFRNQKWPFDGKLHAVKYNLCTYYNKVPAIRYIKDKVFNLEGYKELIFSMDAMDKIASDKLMYIPNDCAQHYPLMQITISCSNVETLNLMNQPIKIEKKFPKLLSRRIRSRCYKTLGTRVKISRMSPPSLHFFTVI